MIEALRKVANQRDMLWAAMNSIVATIETENCDAQTRLEEVARIIVDAQERTRAQTEIAT